ncbi:MAG: glycosyltransferase [Gemmatimonadota bacterium]
MTALGLLTAAGWLAATAMLAAGLRRIPRLRPRGSAPAVTAAVVVAARNEEAHVEAAMRTLLAQRHAGLRIVAVDDRSTDRTGAILDRLAATDGRLEVVHVRELSAAWLGKNHALHVGARAARADFLVFADADVRLHPDAVATALDHALRGALDHLALFPRMRSPGAVLSAAVGVFTVLFALRFRPWLAGDPGSRAHVGVGAFNLVRTEAYRSVGGHQRIALRPDDDLRLGRILKEAGFSSGAAYGDSLAEVEWYGSVPELIRGLRKNAFAAVDYRPWLVALVVASLFAFHVWPFVAVVLLSGLDRVLFGLAAALAVAAFTASARRFGLRAWTAALYPLGAAIIGYAIAAATVRALVTGGVEWRGTVYPLDRLRG